MRDDERETTTIIILLELVFQGSSRSSKVFKVFKVQLSQVAITDWVNTYIQTINTVSMKTVASIN